MTAERQALVEAMQLHQAGRMEEAERAYLAILERDPGNADALHLLGVMHMQAGEYAGGIPLVRSAIAADGDRPEFYATLGRVLAHSARWAEAAQAFGVFVEQVPGSHEGQSDYGMALQESGDLDGAIAAYRRALALDEHHARTHFNLGTAFKRRSNLDGAIAALRRASQLDSGASLYPVTLAGYLLEAGEPAEALRATELGLALEPRSLLAMILQAIARLRLGERDAWHRIVDYQRLIKCTVLQPPPSYADIESFNDALVAQLDQDPSLAFEPSGQATQGGRQTGDLTVRPSGPIAELLAMFESAIQGYVSALPHDATHPFLAHRPAGWRLIAWGVVLRSQGQQLPHTHPDGWVSGVYYARVPGEVGAGSDGRDGWLEFGRPTPELLGNTEPELHAVRPEPGLLVLFPSYFYHNTIPFESPEPRISVAVDAVPRFS